MGTKKKDKEEIIARVRNAGIVGAGGAGFPTCVKLSATAEYLLINGAECEPLLAVDQLLMQKYADELVDTLQTLQEVVGAKEVIFCIKKKYTSAIQQITKASWGHKNIRLHLLEDIYPAGDEQVLVYEVLERVVPEAGIPLNVGAVVMNVETLLNVYFALAENRAVTHTYLTLNGDVSEPVTLRVPVGTPIREILNLFGNGISERSHLLLEGGPMMGKVIENWDAPVVKTTKGLILLPRTSYLAMRYTNLRREITKNVVSICCECQMCTEVCPRFLLGHSIEPHRLMIASAQGVSHDDPIFRTAQFCCECGICELYACFMFLSPRSLNARIKQDLASRRIKPAATKNIFAPHPLREDRRIPTRRVKARLELSSYERECKFIEEPELKNMEYHLLLRQHIGASCKPQVKPGDKVKQGELIADVDEKSLGVPLHSPVTGKVTYVDNEKIIIHKT